jgi:hypothetical protein
MARRRTFSLTREVFKVAKAANTFRKAMAVDDEPVRRSGNASGGRSAGVRSAAVAGGTPADAEYERKILHRLGSPVDKPTFSILITQRH